MAGSFAKSDGATTGPAALRPRGAEANTLSIREIDARTPLSHETREKPQRLPSMKNVMPPPAAASDDRSRQAGPRVLPKRTRGHIVQGDRGFAGRGEGRVEGSFSWI